MNWGSLDREFSAFATKRLTPHEIDPKVSNGHEFQGVNGLAEMLGTEDRRGIPTVYSLMRDREGEPVVEQVIRATASWYDSRRNDRKRNAEWRLYYPAEAGAIQAGCHEGDLMIIGLNRDGSLAVFLAPAGSASEASLIHLLGLGRVPLRGRGNVRWIDASAAGELGLPGAEAARQLSLEFAEALPGTRLFSSAAVSSPEEAALGDTEVERVAAEMIRRWPAGVLGSCADVCRLVTDHCEIEVNLELDRALVRWLEVAEASYWLWEAEMFGRFLGPIRFDRSVSDSALAERVSARWMAYRQSRVSRAGTMMEIFLAGLLRQAAIPFAHGAKIEGGKLPDFLFPGVAEYNDPAWPADKLRILGSKTSFKDRWRQILSEGDRVKSKHGVTRDVAITGAMFGQMRDAGLTVVMPAQVLAGYADKPANLISLSEFVSEVRSLVS